MSRLQESLKNGERVITTELRSIDGTDPSSLAQVVSPLGNHVTAISVTDNPGANAHASSLSVAALLAGLGAEPIMNLSCRDRNRLALQADLLGAALHGIENILCVTGDDVSVGDQPETRRVFDLDSVQLLGAATALTKGQYLSGRGVNPAPRYFLGAVESPSAQPYDYRPHRALKKISAGARFFILQLTFELDRLKAFLDSVRALGLLERAFFLPSVCIVGSARGLRYLDSHVPGVSVPRGLLAEVDGLSREMQRDRCFTIAESIAYQMLELPGVSGLHIIDMANSTAVPDLIMRLRGAGGGLTDKVPRKGSKEIGVLDQQSSTVADHVILPRWQEGRAPMKEAGRSWNTRPLPIV